MAIWGFSVTWGLYFLQLGIATQYAIGQDRPPWLESALFTIAFALPLDPCGSRVMRCVRKVEPDRTASPERSR